MKTSAKCFDLVVGP